MLIGEFHHNIDDKGRLIIPSKFRDELGSDFIVTRGLDGCLYVYHQNDWNKVVADLKTLPFTKKDARAFVRYLLSGATVCEFDKQGRVNLTSPLVQSAELTKECVIVGVNDHLEIWSKQNWEKYFETNEAHISDIADKLFEVNLDL